MKIDQFDTCWLENNGKFAFGANYTSGTISSFRIGDDGSLTVVNGSAGTTLDLPGGNRAGQNRQARTPSTSASSDGRLFMMSCRAREVGAWRINNNGSITKIGEFGGLQTVTVTWLRRSASAPAAAPRHRSPLIKPTHNKAGRTLCGALSFSGPGDAG